MLWKELQKRWKIKTKKCYNLSRNFFGQGQNNCAKVFKGFHLMRNGQTKPKMTLHELNTNTQKRYLCLTYFIFRRKKKFGNVKNFFFQKKKKREVKNFLMNYVHINGKNNIMVCACYCCATLEKKEKVEHKRVIIEKCEQHILNASLCYQSKQQAFVANKTTSNLLRSNLLTL
ncbi:hypothetical protein RFI_29384 [Reticulomyxa filosa]|uniref:Uncharacterized protein n=1 Tax=Reticulomyxa filosa TaxID=46433 RepID=X6M2Z9_RETFI|nr:hypothetical protein RFI_29384 [Reticulomyxa filosa]|eukprot:ETO08006.1 hypothetical protein RFI_29384 [Reticulomyxa filosa]